MPLYLHIYSKLPTRRTSELYPAGMSVKSLAERYGIHRSTVFSHLRRRNVPSRRPGLCPDERAEAVRLARAGVSMRAIARRMGVDRKAEDRKSTRLNSSHVAISYAVFCLKKKIMLLKLMHKWYENG